MSTWKNRKRLEYNIKLNTLVAVRYEAKVCSSLISGIGGSYLAVGMDIRLAASFIGVLPDVCVCLIVCDLETSTILWSISPSWAAASQNKKWL
jgi:hypothetical protein